MQVTVIVNDKFVSVDGEGYYCDFTSPKNLLAVQFSGTSGEAEWTDKNNTKIDKKFITPFLESWNKAKQEFEAQTIAEAERLAEWEQRYDVQRRKNYPSIGDQLDALYKAGLFPEEMAAKIEAVKAAFPKPEVK